MGGAEPPQRLEFTGSEPSHKGLCWGDYGASGGGGGRAAAKLTTSSEDARTARAHDRLSNADARSLRSKRAIGRAGDEPRREHCASSSDLGTLEDEGFPSPLPKGNGVNELLTEFFRFIGQAPIFVFEIGETFFEGPLCCGAIRETIRGALRSGHWGSRGR